VTLTRAVYLVQLTQNYFRHKEDKNYLADLTNAIWAESAFCVNVKDLSRVVTYLSGDCHCQAQLRLSRAVLPMHFNECA
jgi:hypothetical protein